MDIYLIPITISSLALFLSLISLWKSHLAPFKLKVCFTEPRLSLYKITPKMSGGKKTWWIPSIDIGFTFQNLGKKIGEVKDIRMLGTLKSKNLEKKYTFYPKWIVNYPKFLKYQAERFEWIYEAIQSDWCPLILTGDDQKSVHIILEGGSWSGKLIGKMNFKLEIFSSEENQWITYNNYEQILTKDMYEVKDTHILYCDKIEKNRDIEDNWFDEIKKKIIDTQKKKPKEKIGKK